jgi:hypothetical protein
LNDSTKEATMDVDGFLGYFAKGDRLAVLTGKKTIFIEV